MEGYKTQDWLALKEFSVKAPEFFYLSFFVHDIKGSIFNNSEFLIQQEVLKDKKKKRKEKKKTHAKIAHSQGK